MKTAAASEEELTVSAKSRGAGGESPPPIRTIAITLTGGKVRRARVARAGLRAMQKGFGMIRTILAFLSNQDGATAIEYALIASLIAVFLIGALAALGTNLSSEFAEVGAALK